jgi:alkyldihydroxyacetonephosphate synthase
MIRVDRVSLLVDAPAESTLRAIESTVLPMGLTLRLEPEAWASVGALSVADWLAGGAIGAGDAWLDPADHLVAGLEAELVNGRTLVVRPAPRRATGPDLVALVVGARGRFASLRRAWLRIHQLEARRPRTAPFEHDRDPPLNDGEERLLAAVLRELLVR